MRYTNLLITCSLLSALLGGCQPKNGSTPLQSAADEELSSVSGPLLRLSSEDGWRWENPRPVGNLLLALWGNAEAFYAVGDSGTILHFDGKELIPLESGTRALFTGVWGSASEAGELFVVGEEGTLLRSQKGGPFVPEEVGTKAWLRAVWGSSARDVFVVGDGGTILHFDGERWTPQESGVEVALLAITGRGPKDVYAVGEAGTILRYDGESWTRSEADTREALLGVAIFGAKVYACGGAGTVLVSSDGFHFERQPLSTNESFRLLFQDPAGQILAMGTRQIAALGKEGWELVPQKSEPMLAVLTGEKGTIFATASGRLFRWVGEEVKELSGGPRFQLNDVFVSADGQKLATTESGIYEHKGDGWQLVEQTAGAYLEGIDGGAGVIAVGPAGLVLRRTAAGWATEFSGTQEWLTDVYVASAEAAFAVGHKGTFLVRDKNGDWKSLTTPTSYAFSGVAGRSASEVYAVGESGIIYRYDGKALLAEATPVSEDLKAVGVSGELVLVVGKKGTILRRAEEGWQRETSPTDVDLWGLFVSGTGDAYAVGDRGTILRRTREGAWEEEASGTLFPLLGVSGNAKEVVVVGGGGSILRRSLSEP